MFIGGRGLLSALIICASGNSVAEAGPTKEPHDTQTADVLEDGEKFPYDYVVRYWKNNPPGSASSDDPDEAAPGLISRKPATYLHVKMSPAEVAIVERKLQVVSDALLALPPLKDIRGASLQQSINIRRQGGKIEADLNLTTRPISLANPATRNHGSGFYTPGEGASLEIGFNLDLPGRPWEPVMFLGSYNGNQMIDPDYSVVVVNSSRPLTISETSEYDGTTRLLRNPDFFDKTARPSQLQLLTATVSYGSFNGGFASQTHSETSYVARLIAALYMADWNEIVRRMEEVR